MSENTPTPKTVIGPDTYIKGEMTFDSGAVILGRFDGSIHAKGEIEIGESAKCSATLRGQRIIIDGTLTGDAIAAEQVRLNARARVQGDLTAATLVVAEGASYHGMCSVGPDAVKNSVPKQNGQSQHDQSNQQTNGRTTEPKPSNEQPWDRPMVAVSSAASSLKAGLSGLSGLSSTDSNETATRASA